MANEFKYECDVCKEQQVITKPEMEIVEHKTEGKVERYYIKCSKCGASFTSYYVNAKVSELIEKQKKVYQKLKKAHEELAKLRGEVTKEEKLLREKMETKG